MGEIPASEVRPGNVIRQYYNTDFGLHLIEGTVTGIEEHVLANGQKYRRIALDEARCSDVQITAPSGAYLYGVEGMTMSHYAFGVAESAPVRLLCDSQSVFMPREIDAYALPLKSIWNWPWNRGEDESVLVTIEEYFENEDGAWIRFMDPAGSEWVLDPDAFMEQCQFVRLNS